MEPKINISIKFVPSFQFNFEIPKLEDIIENKENEIPWYTRPLTTNIEKIEIRYYDSETYLVPKTTAGMF